MPCRKWRVPSAAQISDLGRVFLRIVDGKLRLGIHYDPGVVEALEGNNPACGLNDENILPFMVFLEELNHAVHAALKFREGVLDIHSEAFVRDLELQAKIDTYLVLQKYCAFFNKPQRLTDADRRWLKACVFDRERSAFEEPLLAERYHETNRLARRYVRHLNDLSRTRRTTEIRRFRKLSYGQSATAATLPVRSATGCPPRRVAQNFWHSALHFTNTIPVSMNILLRLFTSSLGKKFLMAITGAGLFLFVIGHLVGNLQIFLGPESINRYGHFLQTTPEILWPARIGLLAFVIIHIWASISLTIENRAARATGYEVKELVAASTASRTMIWSGWFGCCMLDLAHYTLLVVHPEYRNLVDARGQHDIYQMMILGFSNWCVSGFYILSIGLLCLHLSHGTRAMFQSLGLKNASYACMIDCSAKIVAVLIFLGYISIPIAVLAGVVK